MRPAERPARCRGRARAARRARCPWAARRRRRWRSRTPGSGRVFPLRSTRPRPPRGSRLCARGRAATSNHFPVASLRHRVAGSRRWDRRIDSLGELGRPFKPLVPNVVHGSGSSAPRAPGAPGAHPDRSSRRAAGRVECGETPAIRRSGSLPGPRARGARALHRRDRSRSRRTARRAPRARDPATRDRPRAARLSHATPAPRRPRPTRSRLRAARDAARAP